MITDLRTPAQQLHDLEIERAQLNMLEHAIQVLNPSDFQRELKRLLWTHSNALWDKIVALRAGIRAEQDTPPDASESEG